MAVMLKSACGCISLRVACLIIGYFGSVISALATIYSVVQFSACLYFVVNPEALLELIRQNENDYRFDADGHTYYAFLSTSIRTYLGIVGLPLSIILLAVTTMFLGFYIALLVGVHEKRANHVKAWSIFKMVFIVLGAIASYSSLILGDFGGLGFTLNLLMNTLFIVFHVYVWAVVRSYYNHLKNGNDGAYAKLDEPLKIAISNPSEKNKSYAILA